MFSLQDFGLSDADLAATFGDEFNVFAGSYDSDLNFMGDVGMGSFDQDVYAMGDVGGGAVDGLDFAGDQTGRATAEDLNRYASESSIPMMSSQPSSGGNWRKYAGAASSFMNSRAAPGLISVGGGILSNYMRAKAQKEMDDEQRQRYVDGYRSGSGLSLFKKAGQ